MLALALCGLTLLPQFVPCWGVLPPLVCYCLTKCHEAVWQIICTSVWDSESRHWLCGGVWESLFTAAAAGGSTGVHGLTL